MQDVYDEKCITMELFSHQVQFELMMPGEMLSANTLLKEEDRLVWKVDAYRLLGGRHCGQSVFIGQSFSRISR